MKKKKLETKVIAEKTGKETQQGIVKLEAKVAALTSASDTKSIKQIEPRQYRCFRCENLGHFAKKLSHQGCQYWSVVNTFFCKSVSHFTSSTFTRKVKG